MKEWQTAILAFEGVAAVAYITDLWENSKPSATVSSTVEACGVRAFVEYNRLKTAALMQDTGVPTAETAVAVRRIEESYCRELAACLLSDRPPQQANSVFGT